MSKPDQIYSILLIITNYKINFDIFYKNIFKNHDINGTRKEWI